MKRGTFITNIIAEAWIDFSCWFASE